MKNAFNIGDLVKLIISEHIGIVIRRNEFMEKSQVYIYRIKWVGGKPFTWEQPSNLILVARVNNEKRI